MRIEYDSEANALWIELRQGDPKGYGEDLDGAAIVHRDRNGYVFALELLDARERLGGEPPASVKVRRLAGYGRGLSASKR